MLLIIIIYLNINPDFNRLKKYKDVVNFNSSE